MTRIEELEQIINETAEKFNKEIDKFKAEIEHIKALAELKENKKEGKWKPTYNEMYIYRTDFGDMRLCYWADSEVDEWRYNNIPIFKTTDEYKKYWHFMDTAKEKSYEFSKEEWEDEDIRKFYICYDYKRKIFYPSFAWDCQIFGRFYFETEESAQYIIDNFKDELMEYWI